MRGARTAKRRERRRRSPLAPATPASRPTCARGAARAAGSGQTRSVAQRRPTRGAPTTGDWAVEGAFDVLASGQWDDLKAHAVKKIRALLANLDRELAGRDFPVGSRRTVVDAYLFVYLGWAEKLAGNLAEFKNLARVFARMNADPAVQKVLRDEQA
ncbi:glutathione binding-like protein [Sorangium sp. So ce1128]